MAHCSTTVVFCTTKSCELGQLLARGGKFSYIHTHFETTHYNMTCADCILGAVYFNHCGCVGALGSGSDSVSLPGFFPGMSVFKKVKVSSISVYHDI